MRQLPPSSPKLNCKFIRSLTRRKILMPWRPVIYWKTGYTSLGRRKVSIYKLRKVRSRLPKRLLLVLGSLFVALILAVVVVRHIYTNQLKPASASQRRLLITIPKDTSLRQIAALLEQRG